MYCTLPVESGAVRVEPVVFMSSPPPVPQTRVEPEQLEETVVQVADGERRGSVTSR